MFRWSSSILNPKPASDVIRLEESGTVSLNDSVYQLSKIPFALNICCLCTIQLRTAKPWSPATRLLWIVFHCYLLPCINSWLRLTFSQGGEPIRSCLTYIHIQSILYTDMWILPNSTKPRPSGLFFVQLLTLTKQTLHFLNVNGSSCTWTLDRETMLNALIISATKAG